MSKRTNVKQLSVVAMLCALGYLCTVLFKFKVGFLTFDLKDAVISIASLLYGPVSGLLASLAVAFLEMITVSETGIYGFLMNFLSSGTFALTCGFIYKYRKSMSGAVLGVSASAVSVTSVMMLFNLLITPLYMNVDREVVIGMLVPTLLPFNLTKAVLNGALLLLIYKPFTSALRKMGLVPKSSNSNYKFGIKSVIMIVLSLVVVALTLTFFVLYLEGSFVFIK